MAITRVGTALGCSLAALVLSAAALFVAVRVQLRVSDAGVQRAGDAAVAREQAGRVRSASTMRGLVMGVVSWAADHGGEAPPADGWERALMEAGVLDKAPAPPSGAAVVPVPYHYVRPTAEQVARAASDGAGVVVFYEDPDLWRGEGGTVVTLDTGAVWIDGSGYAARVQQIRAEARGRE